MFRSADPTRRLPVYLQANTKENFFWQLKLTGAFIAGLIVWDMVQERREMKQRVRELHTTD